LQVQKLHTLWTINDVWNRQFAIKNLILEDGQLNLNTDKFGYNNLRHLFFHEQQQIKKVKKAKRAKMASFWKDTHVKTDALEIIIRQLDVCVDNELKKTKISGHINELSTSLNLEAKDLAATIKMNLSVDSLAINPKNGAFLKDSDLKGTFDFIWEDSILTIHPFDMKVNEEAFNFYGQFYTRGDGDSKLIFINEQTRLDKISPLLPKRLQTNLAPYKIPKPFFSKTQILTRFIPHTPPEVIVDFKFANHDLIVHDIPLKQTSLEGQFVNRIYTDERKYGEGKKRFRLALKNVKSQQGQFNIQSESIKVKSTLETGPIINTKADISGNAAGISDWLENDQFIFTKGQFDLSATINGALNDLDNILIETDANLALQDFSVNYLPAKVDFPFQSLKLEKKKGDAFFNIVNNSFVKGEDLLIDGFLKHLPALLLAYSEEQVESEVNLIGKRLSWTDFLNFFEANHLQKNGKTKTVHRRKQPLKTSLKGFYKHFNPQIKVKFDVLEYYDILSLDSFETGVYFEDSSTVILDKTSFLYDGGMVEFSGQLDISNHKKTPFDFTLRTENLNLTKLLPRLNYLNVKVLSELESLPEDLDLFITHKGILDDEKGLIANTSTGKVIFDVNGGKDFRGEIIYYPDTTLTNDDLPISTLGQSHIKLRGNPKVFNNFFKTEEFFFKDGAFKVDFDYAGDLNSIQDLFTKGNATFTLNNSQVFYKSVGVTFPLTEIELTLENDVADFDFFLESVSLDEKIHLLGNIENISELIRIYKSDYPRYFKNVSPPFSFRRRYFYLYRPTYFSSNENGSTDKRYFYFGGRGNLF